jgi:HSP20 family protein
MLMVRRNAQPALSELINNFFDTDLSERIDRSLKVMPRTNIMEKEDSYSVEMLVPGFSKDDFNLNVENDLLIVSAQKEENKEEKSDNKIIFREYNVQSFERSFTLSNDVDSNKIEASYENGILNLMIPKKKEALVKKLIKIK